MDKNIIVFAEEMLGLDISYFNFRIPKPRKLVSNRVPSRFFVIQQQEKFRDLNLWATQSAQDLSRKYSKVLEAMCERFLRNFHSSSLYLTREELLNKYRTSKYHLTLELINCNNFEDFYTLRITKFNIILDEIRFTITTKYGGV